jgi:hypothetical protein
MSGENKVDSKTKQERVHEVGLMLRRKSIPYILNYIKQEWGLEKVQAYNYIKEARVEWEKYFSQVKKCGKSYYVSQLRDLKDQAFGRATVIGRGDSKMVVTVPDLNLVFEITKEEAKLMGIYPSEKHDVNVKGKIEGKVENILKLEEGELDKFIEVLIKRETGTDDSINGKEEKGN